MEQVAGPGSRSGAAPAPARPRAVRRTPDQLLRDAVVIRALLEDLDDADHGVRIRLLLARDQLRLEAARQWHEHGWRPITDER